jgi:hypothetical protein
MKCLCVKGVFYMCNPFEKNHHNKRKHHSRECYMHLKNMFFFQFVSNIISTLMTIGM